MGATRKKHASHTWRSILVGREALTNGLIKWIGDGTSTNIWEDRWIPMHFDARPLTPQDGQQVTMVSELLDGNGNWNVGLISSIFIPVDVNAILRIPLRGQEDDWWAWEPEKHGDYSKVGLQEVV